MARDEETGPRDARRSGVSPEEWETLQRGFSVIASHYERFNRLLSWNFIAFWWREIAALVEGRGRILEVACGPGGLARELRGALVINSDPNATMIRATRGETGRRNEYAMCVAENLPFRESAFDGVVSSFAFRDFRDRRKALEEFLRVLRPGGVAVIAEITKTNKVMSRIMLTYLRRMTPVLSRIVAPGPEGTSEMWSLLAPTYEAIESIGVWEEMMRSVGFAKVETRPLTTGAALVLTGVKP